MEDPVDIWPHLPWLSEEQQRDLAECVPQIEARFSELFGACLGLLARVPQLAPKVGEASEAQLHAARDGLLRELRDGCMGRWDAYESSLRSYALSSRDCGLSFAIHYEIAAHARDILTAALLQSAEIDDARRLRRLSVVQRVIDHSLAIARDEYGRAREVEIRAR